MGCREFVEPLDGAPQLIPDSGKRTALQRDRCEVVLQVEAVDLQGQVPIETPREQLAVDGQCLAKAVDDAEFELHPEVGVGGPEPGARKDARQDLQACAKPRAKPFVVSGFKRVPVDRDTHAENLHPSRRTTRRPGRYLRTPGPPCTLGHTDFLIHPDGTAVREALEKWSLNGEEGAS